MPGETLLQEGNGSGAGEDVFRYRSTRACGYALRSAANPKVIQPEYACPLKRRGNTFRRVPFRRS
jgi:hypothetical protein